MIPKKELKASKEENLFIVYLALHTYGVRLIYLTLNVYCLSSDKARGKVLGGPQSNSATF